MLREGVEGVGVLGRRGSSMVGPSSDRLTPEQLGIHSGVCVSSGHIPHCQ